MSKLKVAPPVDADQRTAEEIQADYFAELEKTITEGSRVILNLLEEHRVATGEKRMNKYALNVLRRGLRSIGEERWKMVMGGKV